MGVAAEGPGRAAAHFTVSVFEKFSGRFFSLDEPLKFGPRQCGQSAAPDKALIDAIAAHPRIIPVNGLDAIQRYDISVRDYMRKHPQPQAHKAYAMEIAAMVRGQQVAK